MPKNFIRFRELQKKIPLSRSTIWRWEREGKFPRRQVLGKNSVAWLSDEIEAWIENKSAENRDVWK